MHISGIRARTRAFYRSVDYYALDDWIAVEVHCKGLAGHC